MRQDAQLSGRGKRSLGIESDTGKYYIIFTCQDGCCYQYIEICSEN